MVRGPVEELTKQQKPHTRLTRTDLPLMVTAWALVCRLGRPSVSPSVRLSWSSDTIRPGSGSLGRNTQNHSGYK